VPATRLLRHPDSASDLAAQLGHDTDQLISYVVSFYVIAQFWLTHHRVFRVVTGHSEGLAWWNFAVDIFAANIVLGSLASLATAKFIKRKGLASAQNPDTAKYLWILIAFLPDIVIRATRRRPGPPPARSPADRTGLLPWPGWPPHR
jgi:hypothetical protein